MLVGSQHEGNESPVQLQAQLSGKGYLTHEGGFIDVEHLPDGAHERAVNPDQSNYVQPR
jgi:hypothetical protein